MVGPIIQNEDHPPVRFQFSLKGLLFVFLFATSIFALFSLAFKHAEIPGRRNPPGNFLELPGVNYSGEVELQIKWSSMGSLSLSTLDLEEISAWMAKHTSKKVLNLNGSDANDSSLVHLYPLMHLQEIHLQQTKVTAEGVFQLQQKLPDCQIVYP